LWAGKFHPAGRRSRGATPFVGAPGGGTDWHFISAAVGLPAPLPGSPNQQPLTCSNNGNNKLSKQLGKQPGSTGEKTEEKRREKRWEIRGNGSLGESEKGTAPYIFKSKDIS